MSVIVYYHPLSNEYILKIGKKHYLSYNLDRIPDYELFRARYVTTMDTIFMTSFESVIYIARPWLDNPYIHHFTKLNPFLLTLTTKGIQIITFHDKIFTREMFETRLCIQKFSVPNLINYNMYKVYNTFPVLPLRYYNDKILDIINTRKLSLAKLCTFSYEQFKLYIPYTSIEIPSMVEFLE